MKKVESSDIIKSRSRVREQAEVFTQEREVKSILALTSATSNRYWRFLEPACGNGNFLIEILQQRLLHLKLDAQEWHPKNRLFNVLKIVSTIYGVDKAPDNITECHARMKKIILDFLPQKPSEAFSENLDTILVSNIQIGDMLYGKDKIFFTEYSTPMRGCFSRRVFALSDMEKGLDKLIRVLPKMVVQNV